MQPRSRALLAFVTNSSLLLAGVVLLGSGLLLQAVYHVGYGRADQHARAFGMDYWAWSDAHVAAMLVVSLFMWVHLALHWKWYQTLIRKKLFARHRLVISLTAVFTLAAITGYLPWCVRLAGGSELMRKALIEVHDKIALVLGVYLAIHASSRLGWYVRVARSLRHSDQERCVGGDGVDRDLGDHPSKAVRARNCDRASGAAVRALSDQDRASPR